MIIAADNVIAAIDISATFDAAESVCLVAAVMFVSITPLLYSICSYTKILSHHVVYMSTYHDDIGNLSVVVWLL